VPDKRYTLVMDHRGTAYAILDEAGAEIGRRQYDTFGVILTQTGTWPTDLAYQTNWQTIQIGNKWWGLSAARMYDFDTGRFSQRDPLQAHANLYLFGDQPLTQVDPSGMLAFDFQKPTEVPWRDQKNPGNALGFTYKDLLDVTCKCVCCDPDDKKSKHRIDCTVVLRLHIGLDIKGIREKNKESEMSPGERLMNRLAGRESGDKYSQSGIYGHEQQHVVSIQENVRNQAQTAATGQEEGKCKYTSPKHCEDSLPSVKKAILGRSSALDGGGHVKPIGAKGGYEIGSGHPGDNPPPPPPLPGLPKRPIGGMEYDPLPGTNVSGNRARRWPGLGNY
jgi:RHS repeat-associated protein